MTQPESEALRLAEALDYTDWTPTGQVLASAAAELRRLHEEIQCEERRFNELWDEFYEAVKTNEELITVLSEVEHYLRHAANSPIMADKAKYAISKATGELENQSQKQLANQSETTGSPIQEPVFWYRPVCDGEMYEGPHHNDSIGGKMLRDEKPNEWLPLYTTPHSATHSADSAESFGKREWVELTDEEIRDIQMHVYSEFRKSVESVGTGKCSPADVYRLIESKLKEKNT